MLQAGSGGAASGYSILTLMAMLWFGLFATDRELAVGAGVLAACAYLPMLLFGRPDYPVEWGHATLLVFIGCSVAGSLRALTRETREAHEPAPSRGGDRPADRADEPARLGGRAPSASSPPHDGTAPCSPW